MVLTLRGEKDFTEVKWEGKNVLLIWIRRFWYERTYG